MKVSRGRFRNSRFHHATLRQADARTPKNRMPKRALSELPASEVREAKIGGSGRRQNLLGFLDKHFMILDDFGPRQGSGRSGRFSGLPDRALETSHHDRPRRESRQHDRGRQRTCLLYTSPSPRDRQKSRMPSSA